MSQRFRFIDFELARAASSGASFRASQLWLPPECDAAGRIVRVRMEPPGVAPRDVARLLGAYASVRLIEQARAVVPLAAYLVLFQVLILRQLVDDSWIITGGLLAVIVGLMLFMEGLKLGLMPFGNVMGVALPRKSTLPVVLFITFLLGVGVTFAEPAIGALKTAGQNVSVQRVPYLYLLLNDWADMLVLVVGASVGLAAVIGTLRFLCGCICRWLQCSASVSMRPPTRT